MSVTADRRVDVEILAGTINVDNVASTRRLSRCRNRRRYLTGG